MSKKLVRPIITITALTLALFFSYIVREKIASSKYTLSDEGQDYVLACQGVFAASWREDNDLISRLRFMHYSMSLRGCSCAAAQIAKSQPDDLEAARIIFVGLNTSTADSPDSLLLNARKLGDQLGISEARLTALVNANVDAFRRCS